MKRFGGKEWVALAASVLLVAGIVIGQNAYSRQQDSGQAQGQAQSQQQDQARYRLDPQGWVLVGYDLNGDNQIDTYEYISAYELERARQGSRSRRQQGQQGQQDQQQFQPGGGRQRMQSGGGMGKMGQGMGQMSCPHMQQMRQRMQQGQQPMQQGQQRMQQGQPSRFGRQGMQQQQQQRQGFRIQGEIRDLQTFSVNGAQHVFAKIDTQAGRTIRVDLGPRSQLQNVNLREGANLTVWGHRGTVDGRTVLLAQRIQANGRTAMVQRQQAQDGRVRLTGTIEQTKTIRTQQGNQHLVARIQTDDGRTSWVDLGPQQDLRRLNLQQGAEINVLGYELVRGGRPVAVVATDVSANNRQLTLDWFGSQDQLRQQLQSDLSSQQARARRVRVNGTIQNTRTVQTRQGQQHLIATVETQAGRTAWVDLGAVEQAQRAQLEQGDEIQVRGIELFRGGRPVAVLATQFEANDQQFNVSRPQMQRRSQSRQQMQQRQQDSGNQYGYERD